MRLAAICPTFRRPSLIPGIIAMFRQQELPSQTSADLWISSDCHSFDSVEMQTAGVFLVKHADRFPTVWHKYNHLIQDVASRKMYDAVVIMEDDDVYLPGYLAEHSRLLEQSVWAAPAVVWFEEFLSDKKTLTHKIDHAIHRFHGSWGFHLGAFFEVGGCPTNKFGSDTGLYTRLKNKFGDPGVLWSDTAPQYVYRWQTSGYPNAHGFGEDMHEKMLPSHPPVCYSGDFQEGLDERQESSLRLVEQTIQYHQMLNIPYLC